MKELILYLIVTAACIGTIVLFYRVMINTRTHKENEAKAYLNHEDEMKL